jgi:hypothetical protein
VIIEGETYVGVTLMGDDVAIADEFEAWVKQARSCPSARLERDRAQARSYMVAAISVSFATVLMLRAVPVFAAGITSFDEAMPSS